MKYIDSQLLDRVKSLPSFTHLPDYLLIGVRSKADAFDKFDDKFYLFVKGVFYTSCTGTTNCGKTVLQGGWKKYNNLGAALIKSDEIYYDVYQYGLHKAKMPALRQIKAMKYYRDADNDTLSEEQGTVYTGIYNTNFHFNDYDIHSPMEKQTIGGWSAGCQVANQSEGYNKIINKCRDDKALVTYALLKEF